MDIKNMAAAFKAEEEKDNFFHDCALAFEAAKLSFTANIDLNTALRLETRYWEYADATCGSPLTWDEATNALCLILEEDTVRQFLEMPVEEYFGLVSETALRNMSDVVESHTGEWWRV